jgi:transposase
MLTAERQRVDRARPPVRTRIQAHIPWLEPAVADRDDELQRTIRRRPVWRAQEDLLRRVPGIGPIVAMTLLADLPARGRRPHQQLAAVGGLAPRHGERGTRRGTRLGWGGCGRVRSGLSRAAVVASRPNPISRAFYDRLVAAGTAKTVALVAGLPKLVPILNALIHHRTPWAPPTVAVKA